MNATQEFESRHLGPRPNDIKSILDELGENSLDSLTSKIIPSSILMKPWSSQLPLAVSEHEALAELKQLSSKNKPEFRTLIGLGYYNTYTPPVIQRNLLENPNWYTQYTAYQAEISQGRLESLLNFQTMVCELTGLEYSNASLLDEATAAAEALSMVDSICNESGQKFFYVADSCFPQTIEVIRVRAEARGIKIKVESPSNFVCDDSCFGALVQYPTESGELVDYEPLAQKLHQSGAKLVVAADIMALTILRTPKDFGADIAVGSAQRFGVPLGYGGPHAAYLACNGEFLRKMPGRMVGVSRDRLGQTGYRLALQTREQHIRREKATSNICTSQVLLANMAAMYAMYHGPVGLVAIAKEIAATAKAFGDSLLNAGFQLRHKTFFDTLSIQFKDTPTRDKYFDLALKERINLRKDGAVYLGISFDETSNENLLLSLAKAFGLNGPAIAKTRSESKNFAFSTSEMRKDKCLKHEKFNRYHSETELMRYLHRLESYDLSLTSSMIPLGSCTMKLNAAAELMPVSWPEFSQIHPFAPLDQTEGYKDLFKQLASWLCELTGFSAFSLQPNSGAQGEYAGLLVIRKYHQAKGQSHRNICLIPSSAHGTNPASAVMAGMTIVVVRCDEQGNIDLLDLKTKAETHSNNLAALMVTYPSTHGVFEESIEEMTAIIHKHGGQVYMDGANFNAQVGLCKPAQFGADVCHLNLHKTFCIPHGGGGPGVGPIGVASHLAPFIPSHPLIGDDTKQTQNLGPITAAPWGSASILPISWMYIRMMGFSGLRKASQVAMLNANYISKRLEPYFKTLYRGRQGFVAHECILDLREIKKTTGIEVEDVAKRLMDYGFHAPTMAWPVAGTLMVEPTESESKAELDRFCDAMISIANEISEIEKGKMDRTNNPLKNAPHPAESIVGNWDHPYSRETAAFPISSLRGQKFWPKVARVDNAYGDRNLVCSCPSIEEY